MNLNIFSLSLGLLLLVSCGSSQSKKNENLEGNHPFTNELINETSPYLLQHAHNPVKWYPWGEKALKKAKDENKLLLISIGYSACHWCHVMEHESFEDTAVANFMNANFVNIKIDREERPDIDQVYMDAVQLLTGSGGWPLNCFALPDGRPFYGGTYFPKEKWVGLMKNIQNFKTNSPEKLEEQASNLTQGINENNTFVSLDSNSNITKEDISALYKLWEETLDFEKGGKKTTQKFPLPSNYEFLLKFSEYQSNKRALEAVNITLTQMANGGIYDQIGGGFSRYSTDANWKVPHFEKMLYDNAQLLSLYSNAYKKTKNPIYKTIVEETSEFIERELRSTSGGVFSSLDADSEGKEGKYYVWSKKELAQIDLPQKELILDYFSVTEQGNWEHGNNILFIKDRTLYEKSGISEEVFTEDLKTFKNTLLKVRSQRVKPGLDDKILTSWNALLIKGYTDAYKAFGDEKYLSFATQTAQFILNNMKKEDGRLFRNYKNNKTSINGFLDDYVFTVQGLVGLYQSTFEEKWLMEAEKLINYVNVHFKDEKSPFYFYTSNLDPDLIVRKKVIADNVIPSANSELAKQLFTLGHYLYKPEWIEQSKTMAGQVKEQAKRNGGYYSNWSQLFLWQVNEPNEVAIVGDDYKRYLKEWNSKFLPNALVLGGGKNTNLDLLSQKYREGQTTIYVCRNKACKMPVYTVEKAMDLLD
ncbi:MAG: thioredoxin domain-containing protein [Flavobacteriales bacterium]